MDTEKFHIINMRAKYGWWCVIVGGLVMADDDGDDIVDVDNGDGDNSIL